MDGWENTWEKADACAWDALLSLEVAPPLGINSLAVGFGVYLKIKYSKLTHFKPKKTMNLLGIIPQCSIYWVKYFIESHLQCFLVFIFLGGIIKFLEEKFSSNLRVLIISFVEFNFRTWKFAFIVKYTSLPNYPNTF